MDSPSAAPAGSRQGASSRQFLTFLLGREEYGVPILRVQEIRSRSTITPIPNTTPDVLGVVNLRGDIVPVLDLRRCFGQPALEDDRLSVTIMVSHGNKVVGLRVDAVSDVIDLAEDDIASIPDIGANHNSFLTGMAKSDARLVQLLDVDRVIADRPAATDPQDPWTPRPRGPAGEDS